MQKVNYRRAAINIIDTKNGRRRGIYLPGEREENETLKNQFLSCAKLNGKSMKEALVDQFGERIYKAKEISGNQVLEYMREYVGKNKSRLESWL